MNTKIVLLTLTVISASISAVEVPVPQSCLKEIMLKRFNRGTSDQDLIEARDERGFTILHILTEEMMLAPDAAVLLKIMNAMDSMPQSVKEQLIQENNQNSISDFANSLHDQYQSDQEKIALMNANLTFMNSYVTCASYLEKNSALKRKNIELQKENNTLQNKQMNCSGSYILPGIAGGFLGFGLGVAISHAIRRG